MTRLIHHYGGWNAQRPDPRDRSFNAEERIYTAAQLPRHIDLWDQKLVPGIWDQKTIGSCTAHGSLRAYVTEANRQGIALPAPPPPPVDQTAVNSPLSRLMQYYDTRSLEGTVGVDAGGTVRDAIRALATFGCAPETSWPYRPVRFAATPPPVAYAEAKRHMAIKYQGLDPAGPNAPIRSAVAAGLAVVFGFGVPSYFEDGTWNASMPLPLPTATTQFIGGHCVTITGYDFTKTRFPVNAFLCDNSWSLSWGASFTSSDQGAGRFAIDAEWVNPANRCASDFWVIQQDT